eukprot:5412813-Pyramimonas_sp.AAC.1
MDLCQRHALSRPRGARRAARRRAGEDEGRRGRHHRRDARALRGTPSMAARAPAGAAGREGPAPQRHRHAEDPAVRG